MEVYERINRDLSKTRINMKSIKIDFSKQLEFLLMISQTLENLKVLSHLVEDRFTTERENNIIVHFLQLIPLLKIQFKLELIHSSTTLLPVKNVERQHPCMKQR